jgi:hypothetical protein
MNREKRQIQPSKFLVLAKLKAYGSTYRRRSGQWKPLCLFLAAGDATSSGGDCLDGCEGTKEEVNR